MARIHFLESRFYILRTGGHGRYLEHVKRRMSGEEADVDADSSSNSRSLTEKYVSGASLNGKDPTRLTIPQLKRWLLCRDASTKGKKADLVARSVRKFKTM